MDLTASDGMEKTIEIPDDSQPITASFLVKVLGLQTDQLEKKLESKLKATEENLIKHSDEQIKVVREDVEALKEQMKQKDDEIRELRRENEKQKRHRNLILHKIPETESNGRALKDLITKTILTECKVDITPHIDFIFRIGKQYEGKIRPVLLSLTSFDQKMNIMWSRKHYDSKLEISDDFPRDIAEERKRLTPMLQTLRELNYQNVHLKYDKLYVGGSECDEARYLSLIAGKQSLESNGNLSSNESESTNSDKNPFETPTPFEPSTPSIKKRGRSSDDEILPLKKVDNTKLKTTIVGINQKNSSSGRNPIKDALRDKAFGIKPK